MHVPPNRNQECKTRKSESTIATVGLFPPDMSLIVAPDSRRLQRQPVEALNHYIFFAGAGYDQCIGTDSIQAAQCRVNA